MHASEMLSISGFNVSVLDVEHITLQPLQPMSEDRVESENAQPDVFGGGTSFDDVEVVVHEGPDVYDQWVEVFNRNQQKNGGALWRNR